MVVLTEALSKYIQDMKNANLIRDLFITPIKGVFERTLNKFNEDVEVDSPYVVETFDSNNYRVELIYISEPEKWYYIRFEWLY